MRKAGLLFLSVVLLSSSLQAKPVLREGEIVTVKIPSALFERDSGWTGAVEYIATIQSTSEGVSVASHEDWKTQGFPSMVEAKVHKINENKKKNYMEVELRSGSTRVKLRFEGHHKGDSRLNEAFAEVVVAGTPKDEAAKSYLDEAYRALADKFFTGELANLSEEKKKTLVVFAHVAANGTTVGSTIYKDGLYLFVDLGSDTSVYNSLQLNQSQRVAKVINDKLLAVLKAFAKPVEDVPEVYGVKLKFEVPYKSFLEQTAAPEYERLEIYAPSSDVKSFAEADITSQELMDKCTVIVDDNRVQVALSES